MILITLEGCSGCIKYRKKHPKIPYIELPKFSRGFGDTFAKITHFFGIKQCKNCERRQKKWNFVLSYFGFGYPKQYRYIVRALDRLKVYNFPVLLSVDFKKILPLKCGKLS